MSNDRRKHMRVSLDVEVDVSSDSNFFVGKTRDLSMGGLFIETPIALPIGTTVTVQLKLKGRKHDLAADVMWALDTENGTTVGIGVEFKNLGSKAHNAILAFMKERAPVEFEMFEPEPEEEVEETAVADGVPAAPSGGKPPPLPT